MFCEGANLKTARKTRLQYAYPKADALNYTN